MSSFLLWDYSFHFFWYQYELCSSKTVGAELFRSCKKYCSKFSKKLKMENNFLYFCRALFSASFDTNIFFLAEKLWALVSLENVKKWKCLSFLGVRSPQWRPCYTCCSITVNTQGLCFWQGCTSSLKMYAVKD